MRHADAARRHPPRCGSTTSGTRRRRCCSKRGGPDPARRSTLTGHLCQRGPAGAVRSDSPPKPIAHDDPELPPRSYESPSTTHQYLAADLAMKERALAALDSPRSAVPRFRPSDSPLAFLRGFESASAKRRQTCSHVTSGNKHWSRRADKWGCGPDNDFSANSTPPFPSLDRA
ncbi:MAG: hypothetical protein E6I99_15305 [Chloroflexi bacterium]|nr:MAG: hypothetical protein E6I99_15305 [Chloroflexota bacterium]